MSDPSCSGNLIENRNLENINHDKAGGVIMPVIFTAEISCHAFSESIIEQSHISNHSERHSFTDYREGGN